MTEERGCIRGAVHKQEMNKVKPKPARIAFLQWFDDYVVFDPKSS